MLHDANEDFQQTLRGVRRTLLHRHLQQLAFMLHSNA